MLLLSGLLNPHQPVVVLNDFALILGGRQERSCIGVFAACAPVVLKIDSDFGPPLVAPRLVRLAGMHARLQFARKTELSAVSMQHFMSGASASSI